MDKMDQTMENTTNDKTSPFNTICRNNSKILKVKSERNMKSPAAMKLNASQLEGELLAEVDRASKLIQNFKDKIMIETYAPSSNSLQSLKILEDVIKSKDLLIQEIEEEIKMLKSGTYHFHPDTKDKQENNVFRLANQIKMQREQLKKYQNKFLEKQTDLHKKKQLLSTVERRYQEKCRKEGLKELTLEQFKLIYKKKKRQEQQLMKNKKFQKNSITSIKQIIKEKQLGDTQPQTKKMKELMGRKNVAETALKTAKKKHQLEMNDLMGKLQFLRDQNTDLQEKLQMKEQELRQAEGKFSESRTNSVKKVLIRRFRTEQKI